MKPEGSYILVDLDSTVARKVSRHYYQWERVGRDEPIQNVIDFVVGYPAKIIVMTGRNEGYSASPKLLKKFPQFDAESLAMVGRVETEAWVDTYLGPVEQVIMKAAGDFSVTSKFKIDTYLRLIEEGYDIEFIIDDNEAVCNAFRAIGLLTLQVADVGQVKSEQGATDQVYRELFRQDNSNRSDSRQGKSEHANNE